MLPPFTPLLLPSTPSYKAGACATCQGMPGANFGNFAECIACNRTVAIPDGMPVFDMTTQQLETGPRVSTAIAPAVVGDFRPVGDFQRRVREMMLAAAVWAVLDDPKAWRAAGHGKFEDVFAILDRTVGKRKCQPESAVSYFRRKERLAA